MGCSPGVQHDDPGCRSPLPSAAVLVPVLAPLVGQSSTLQCSPYGASGRARLLSSRGDNAPPPPPYAAEMSKKVTSPRGNRALEEQRFVQRLLSSDRTRPSEEMLSEASTYSHLVGGAGKNVLLATHEKLAMSVLNHGERKINK